MEALKIGGLAIGAIGLIAALILGLLWEEGGFYDHDPLKLLQLRKACLENSPNLLTTYCDKYAEKFSRIHR